MNLNILIDGNNLAVRTLTSTPGYNSAFNSPHQLNFFVHSFLSNLLSISNKIKQKYNTSINLVLVWDSKISLRKKLYPEYKANRKPKSLEEEADKKNHYSLLNELKENLKTLGDWACIEKDGFEADDLIAYFIGNMPFDNNFIIVSSDNDFYQLLSKRVIQYLPHKKVFYNHLDFQKEFGIIPDKYPFIKALAGDRGDNIIGIDGIGIKKAIKLMNQGQCWMNWVNKYKETDLETNLELIKLPFHEQDIKIEMPMSNFNKEAWVELFQKFALQKLHLKDFKDLLS